MTNNMMIKIYKEEEIQKIIDYVSELYDKVYKDSITEKGHLKNRINNSLKLKRNTIILTEEHDGQIIGVLFGFDFKKENWWAQQIIDTLPKEINWFNNSFELNELFVDCNFQGRKVGYDLLSYLSNSGFDYILLSVKKTNEKAIHLYNKLGYESIEKGDFYFKNGTEPFKIMCKNNKSN